MNVILFICLVLSPVLIQALLYKLLNQVASARIIILAFFILLYIVIPLILFPDPAPPPGEEGGHCGMPMLAAMMIRFVIRFIGIAVSLTAHFFCSAVAKSGKRRSFHDWLFD